MPVMIILKTLKYQIYPQGSFFGDVVEITMTFLETIRHAEISDIFPSNKTE